MKKSGHNILFKFLCFFNGMNFQRISATKNGEKILNLKTAKVRYFYVEFHFSDKNFK